MEGIESGRKGLGRSSRIAMDGVGSKRTAEDRSGRKGPEGVE